MACDGLLHISAAEIRDRTGVNKRRPAIKRKIDAHTKRCAMGVAAPFHGAPLRPRKARSGIVETGG